MPFFQQLYVQHFYFTPTLFYFTPTVPDLLGIVPRMTPRGLEDIVQRLAGDFWGSNQNPTSASGKWRTSGMLIEGHAVPRFHKTKRTLTLQKRNVFSKSKTENTPQVLLHPPTTM